MVPITVADLGFVKGGSQMSMLGNPLTRLRKSPYQLGKLVRGIPYLLRTKTTVEKRKRELENFFLKSFKRGSFSYQPMQEARRYCVLNSLRV